MIASASRCCEKRTSKTVRLVLRRILEDEVHFYFNAADVVVLSHREGLNSGVAVLGMSFSRVVVGPDCGCIPHVLGAGENVIYEAGNVKALASAMEQAATMDYSSAGQRNRSVVEHWKWSATVAAVADQLPRAATRAGMNGLRQAARAGGNASAFGVLLDCTRVVKQSQIQVQSATK